MRTTFSSPLLALPALVLVAGVGTGAAFLSTATQVPSTVADFSGPGTQPSTLTDGIVPSGTCAGCHGYFDYTSEPYRRWVSSMMAQSSRDPIFHACLTIANQDAANAGELCLRCHMPGGWLQGRSVPTDGSALDEGLGDFDGVNCSICHRLVDPVAAAENPASDAAILAGVGPVPAEPHSAQMVFDPFDRRRGPFDLGPMFFWHQWEESPYHRESKMCSTCHDVSNPMYVKQGSDYVLDPLGQAHPTGDKLDQFPLERTYSEWSRSDFAERPQLVGVRFGGNKEYVASCQDCHMPDTTGEACAPGLGAELRTDQPQHDFAGANSWVMHAVRSLYSDSETGMDGSLAAGTQTRNVRMLWAASDLQLFRRDQDLVVRVINYSGHKLPTGYIEGRRAWVNVEFQDASNQTILEHGAYDELNADLTTADTKVYEAVHGLSPAVASLTGRPVGESFHFALNNVIEKDNRIPPRGFKNSEFAAVQAEPVGTTYLDEQYWDETVYAIPPGAARAVVVFAHQTTSKEYITFLRDENTTDTNGQTAYDQWVLHGKSAPIGLDRALIDLSAPSCATPIPYGLAKETSNGRVPRLTGGSSPSAANPTFALQLENAIGNAFGVVLRSTTTASVNFQGGKRLVGPFERIAGFMTDASGKATIQVPTGPSGTVNTYQVVFRDLADPAGFGLSDGLWVEFCD